MTGLAAVVGQLVRMDDAAWEALASKGLLRRARKDLAALGPNDIHVAAGQDAVTVLIGSNAVVFPVTGLTAARCSCPSGSVCQHIVAAGLWLVEHEGTGSESREEPAPEAVPDRPRRRVMAPTPEQLHDELMGLGPERLKAHAGLDGLRRAHAWLDESANRPVVQGAPEFTVSFEWPRVSYRFLGGGVGGMLADAQVARADMYVVAAVLAYQRAFGGQVTAPEPPKSRGVSPRAQAIEASRVRLRAACATLIEDTVRVGLSRLSPEIASRFETMSTWGHGAQYPRLSLSLKRIADHAELLLRRDAMADEHRMLGELARTYALVEALEVASAVAATDSAEVPIRLVGTMRNTYEPIDSLNVVGLGAIPWESQTGFSGLTTLFTQTRVERFWTMTDARPESMFSFDPVKRWRQPGPWSGLHSPSSTAGAQIALTRLKATRDAKISAAEATRAVVRPLSGPELMHVLPAALSFADAVSSAAGVDRSLLDEPRGSATWAVVRPLGWSAAVFDVSTQWLSMLMWDADGTALPLEVQWSRHQQVLIERLEALSESPFPTGALLVVRLWPRARGMSAEPVSLVYPDADEHPVDVLSFPPGRPSRAKARPSKIASAMRGRVVMPSSAAAAPSAQPVPDAAHLALPGALTRLRGWLEGQAESGVGGVPADDVLRALGAQVDAARQAGFTVFPAQPHADPAVAVLRTHFVVQQVSLALGTPEPPDDPLPAHDPVEITTRAH